MWRKVLVLLLVLGVAVIALLLVLPTPPPPAPVVPPPPPVVKPPAAKLQADAEGFYVPGYRFAVNDLRFKGFSLRPDAFVTFTRPGAGTEESVGCDEAVIRADAVHLRCNGFQGGTVIIDGKFLTRLATTRLDVPVVSAVVTVRSGSGETMYSARDRFTWQPTN